MPPLVLPLVVLLFNPAFNLVLVISLLPLLVLVSPLAGARTAVARR
jgi:hypothetical protein